MFSIALVVFREVFEIALILGVLMAATQGVAKRIQWVWIGVLGGITGSIVIAIFADFISQALEGMGQEVLNATILLIAAALIGWTVIWMTRHGRVLAQEFRQIGQHVVCGYKPIHTLALVVALSVLREGSEIVMFTYSSYVTGTSVPHLILGGLLGTSAGAAIGMMIYYGLMKVPTKQIFSVTSWLLVLLVAGMVSQAFGFLTAAGKVPEIIPIVWDSSRIIAENSFLGKIMHVLMGYTDKPSGIQIIMYILTIGGLVVALKTYGQGGLQQMKKAVAIMVLGLGFMMSHHQVAFATEKVYSPIVVKGEKEIEILGEYDHDKRAEKDKFQQEKWALGYGVTDNWFTEIYGEVEKEHIDPHFSFTALEWENRFQLAEQGKYFIDPGFIVEYEASFKDKTPSKMAFGPLFEKQVGSWVHTTNWIFTREVGPNQLKKMQGKVGWSTKYLLNPLFDPGFEYHADFGVMRKHNDYDAQSHQVGPNFYGKVGKMRYDVGYLFGISATAPHGAFKWIFEYEF